MKVVLFWWKYIWIQIDSLYTWARRYEQVNLSGKENLNSAKRKRIEYVKKTAAVLVALFIIFGFCDCYKRPGTVNCIIYHYCIGSWVKTCQFQDYECERDEVTRRFVQEEMERFAKSRFEDVSLQWIVVAVIDWN